MTTWTPEQIKLLRLRTNWTQADLAHRLGVSRRTVEAWESGLRTMRPIAARMLDLLDETIRRRR